MNGMTTISEELKQQIIARLEDSHNINDIILDLCESQGLEWKEAEAIVNSIHAENADDITLTQSPILVLIALASFLGGLGAIAFAAVNLAGIWIMIYENQADFDRMRFFSGIFYLAVNGIEYFGLVVLGIGMIIGSLRGMSEVWSAIFAKLGWFQGVE